MNYQLILVGHRRCFLEENKLSFSYNFLLTVILAEQLIVPKKCPQKSVYKMCPQTVDKKSPQSIKKKCP